MLRRDFIRLASLGAGTLPFLKSAPLSANNVYYLTDPAIEDKSIYPRPNCKGYF